MIRLMTEVNAVTMSLYLKKKKKTTLLQYGGLGGGFAGENNRQIWMMEPGQRDSTWRGVSARLDQHSIPGY